MISSVLVANRGEIARRVFRSCRELGLATVAVYSDPDAAAPHVDEADVAVRLPGSAAADTYLRADLLIDAARRAGADAVHPGYGFLSEHADFAAAVLAAGLTWIGPPPAAIAAMGSKIESKRLMAAAGVPVLTALDPAAISEADLPVLIKAAAGGGGRGMRIVRSLADLPDALTAAGSEAASAFGDPAVFCEPYVQPGRHIEVQVLADAAGTVWTIGERECSIQRRHQKIIEEAPSPLVERIAGMRERLFAAARLAATAIGYVNAGTVEFLADESGRFWFLEMNTRLQVEHPVTEATTGLDLVTLQLQVAAGRPLPPDPPPVAGHAIEARLYAEDPAADWQPQTGPLHRFELLAPMSAGVRGVVPPGSTARRVPVRGRRSWLRTRYQLPVLRADSGVISGSQVSSYYDPMLAKVIAWADDREQAAAVLAHALATARIHGLITNRDLLVNVLRHPAFGRGADGHRLLRDARPERARRAAGRTAGHPAVGARCGARGRRGPPAARQGARRVAARLAERPVAATAHQVRRARRRVPAGPGRADRRGPGRRPAAGPGARTGWCWTWPASGTRSGSRPTPARPASRDWSAWTPTSARCA